MHTLYALLIATAGVSGAPTGFEKPTPELDPPTEDLKYNDGQSRVRVDVPVSKLSRQLCSGELENYKKDLFTTKACHAHRCSAQPSASFRLTRCRLS